MHSDSLHLHCMQCLNFRGLGLCFLKSLAHCQIMFWGVARCYFPSAADGKVSKREAFVFRPPRTEKKSMRTLFSVHADGNLCAQSAIFRP